MIFGGDEAEMAAAGGDEALSGRLPSVSPGNPKNKVQVSSAEPEMLMCPHSAGAKTVQCAHFVKRERKKKIVVQCAHFVEREREGKKIVSGRRVIEARKRSIGH